MRSKRLRSLSTYQHCITLGWRIGTEHVRQVFVERTLQREDQTKTWTRLIEKKERSINRYEPNESYWKRTWKGAALEEQVAHLKRLMYNINEHGNVRTSLPTLQ